MQQFNLSEWLKDKSHKVVTRSGIEVEIIHDENPLVAIINGEAYNFDNDGKFQSNKSNHKYDLFFADEEELTEFENMLRYVLECYSGHEFASESEIETLKLNAKSLLDLAKKELQPEFDEEMGKMLAETDKVVYQKGQKDALKDLPKWKKCVDSTGPFIDYFRGDDYLYLKGYVIKVSELFKKLPKGE